MQIQAFMDTIDVCMLLDIGFKGRFWTFERRVAGGTYTRCRLDRALVNTNWMARYPMATIEHLSAATSDNGPILLDFGRAHETVQNRSFRYEAMWEKHEDFRGTAETEWAAMGPCAMVHQLQDKLSRVSMGLTRWNK